MSSDSTVVQIEDAALYACIEAVDRSMLRRQLAEEERDEALRLLEQARRWGVEMENRAAQWERVALAWAPLVSGYCSEDSTRKTARGSHVACSLPKNHDKGCVFIPTVDGWADQ